MIQEERAKREKDLRVLVQRCIKEGGDPRFADFLMQQDVIDLYLLKDYFESLVIKMEDDKAPPMMISLPRMISDLISAVYDNVLVDELIKLRRRVFELEQRTTK